MTPRLLPATIKLSPLIFSVSREDPVPWSGDRNNLLEISHKHYGNGDHAVHTATEIVIINKTTMPK